MFKARFAIMIGIYLLIHIYLFVRGWQAMPKQNILQPVFSIVFLICSLSFIATLLFGQKINLTLSVAIENIGAFWIIMLLYLIIAAIFADLLRLSNYFFHYFPTWVLANYAQVKLIYLGTVLITITVLSLIGYHRFSNPQVVNLNIDIAKKTNHLEELNIVAASDVHMGSLIRKERLEKYVELINKQNPDVILLVGDVFDHNIRLVEAQRMDTILGKLKAKYGVFAVFGNHEYFGDIRHASAILKRAGIKLLRDETACVDNKFIIIGRDDYSQYNRKTIKALIDSANTNLPTIVLDHQPFHLNKAVENNIDLQLSGHTHNGQIFPLNYIVSKIYELAYGYQKIGNTHFYVSSGIGLWGAPIRIATKSEIVRLTLHFAK